MVIYRSNQFIIRMSRDTISILKRHLQEKKHNLLLNIIQEHLYLDMYEGVARNKEQIDATSGAMVGEATRQGNKIVSSFQENCFFYLCIIAENVY